MSKSRGALLQILRNQGEPVTLATLARLTGLHPNTLREHLKALVELGLVGRRGADPHGRGRPVWLYRAIHTGEVDGGSEYAGLAATLASAIRRYSGTPREDAIGAGAEWGHELARAADTPTAGAEAPTRHRVAELLDRMGFAPVADADESAIRLTRCPLLTAARRYPDVVCGVHVGIVRGALEEYGADPTGFELLPFSEPGACRLELGNRRTRSTP